MPTRIGFAESLVVVHRVDSTALRRDLQLRPDPTDIQRVSDHSVNAPLHYPTPLGLHPRVSALDINLPRLSRQEV